MFTRFYRSIMHDEENAFRYIPSELQWMMGKLGKGVTPTPLFLYQVNGKG